MDQKNRLLREAYELLHSLLNKTYVGGSLGAIEKLQYRIAKNLKITPEATV